METIKGKVKKIFAIKGAWASFIVDSVQYGEIKCAGNTGGSLLIETQEVSLEGEKDMHPVYGLQFKISKVEVKQKANEAGIIQYLCSGFVKGIGPAIAIRVVDRFGSETMDVIKNDPEQLLQIKGITRNKLDTIKNSIIESQIYMDIVKYFDGNITENQTIKIYERYGNKALDIIKKNPYQLIYDIDGFGFKKVDKLALASGIKVDSSERIGAAIVYTLKKLTDNGNCFCYEDDLELNLKECLAKEKLDNPVPINKLADEIMNQVNQEKLVLINKKEHVLIYLKNIRDAEIDAAKFINGLYKKKKQLNEKDLDKKIKVFETKHNVTFDEIQKNAAKMAVINGISSIIGGPGMGKTTIIELIIYLSHEDVLLIAPTGRAAKRMSEVTGWEAFTVAKLLSSHNKYYNSLFICDESSMLDIVDACHLLRIVEECNSRIVFVGDIHQLPSIGPGSFLRDLVNSKVCSTKLNFSYRFGGKIAANANAINSGVHTNLFECDDSFKVINSKKEIIQKYILDEYVELYNQYGVREVMCLVPMRVRSMSAANTINQLIREQINPGSNQLKSYDIRIGDRVMNISNNYKHETFNTKTQKKELGIFNGDMGVVTDIDVSTEEVTVIMDDDRKVVFAKKEIQDLILAYAMTYHKSQGSEAKAVIAVFSNEHFIMSNRNLLYTGVTRAKEKIRLIGDVFAFNKAIDNVKELNRNTLLVEDIEKATF